MRELNMLLLPYLCLLERMRWMQHTVYDPNAISDSIDLRSYQRHVPCVLHKERPASIAVKLLIKPKGVTKTLPLQKRNEAMTAKDRTTKEKKIIVAARKATTEAVIDKTALQVTNRCTAIESDWMDVIRAQLVFVMNVLLPLVRNF